MGRAEQTREMIIEKSAILFNKKGVVGTSISDIIKETKVAKGCLYGHFENKEVLALAIVDYLIEKITKKAASLVDSKNTAKEKVGAFIEIFNSPVNNPFIDGGCPILNFGVDSDNTDPAIKKKVRASANLSTKTLESIMKTGIENGEFSSKLNPAKQALKIMAIMEGAMLLSRVMESDSKMDTLAEMVMSELELYALN